MNSINFRNLKTAPSGHEHSIVKQPLPSGKKEGNEWMALNPVRYDKNLDSFRINLINGKWIDHATADKGENIISLVAYLNGTSQYEEAQPLLGNNTYLKTWNLTINPSKVHKPAKVNISEYINKLWNEVLDTKNSIVETYLHHRGLLLENIPKAIGYHPNTYHKTSGKYFPTMLSAVTKYRTDNIIALHHTYLKADGIGKADISPNKMILGKVKAGALVITPATSTLVIAQEIGTALSVYATTGFSTWANFSSWGMVNVQVPPIDTAQKIIIAADADATGITSANKLATKLLEEGYKVSIAMPSQGTDFNNLLKEGN
ncbi:MAG: toprim domain-containing protein [Candidatus Megaira endosymbiont of Mesostigma viride]|jgi:hypothetical protein|nr:MAG: toprim domain-containing protein [Candidatus Megaira endosymbiont of Mesostigma viride]HJK87913.1 toprim domain-containing protein [Candidatus Megaira endosymbiont of Mesostigma viride]